MRLYAISLLAVCAVVLGAPDGMVRAVDRGMDRADVPGAALDDRLAGMVEPIVFTMEAERQQYQQVPPSGQSGNYRPVTPQPYKRKCGTIATDVCATDVAIPAGATGEQLYQMAGQAEAQGRKGDALTYLEKSAEMGYARAQAAVGINYAEGKGMTRDDKKALYYLGLAAGQGNRGAEAKLGEMYEKGDGVPEDHARAIKYYEAAAAQHDSNAEFALGVDYEFGSGVGHNRNMAIQYLRRSSVDGGDTYGSELATMLAKAPATRQFHNFDEITAYMHPPPPPGKAGSCPVLNVNTTGPNAQGAIYLFCQCHPGCTYRMPAFGEMACSNKGAQPYCNGQ